MSKLAGSFVQAMDVALAICRSVDGDVSIEVTTNDLSEMIDQGTEIANLASNAVVKLPITPAGLQACAALSKRCIKTNLTLCFSLRQALLAAKNGATYVSPFIGRIDDVGECGLSLVQDIVECYSRYGYSTQVLAASIRNIQHLEGAAKIGAYAATISHKLLTTLVDHPLTTAGLKKFEEDWFKAS